MYLLGIDIGTTALKTLLFDSNGNIIATASAEYQLVYPEIGWMECEVESYWKACRLTIREILKKSRIVPQQIRALSISCQGETFVPVDRSINPLRRAIVWPDRRSESECKLIESRFGSDEIYKVTGQNTVATAWTATKILWLKRNEPNVHKKTYKYLLLKDYIIYKFTGILVTDNTQADSTLMQRLKGGWWNEMLNFVGVDEDQLPELKLAGEYVGCVTKEASEETGLSTKTIVSVGAYDHAAAAVGAGNIVSGMVSECTGASLGMVATIDEIILDHHRRIACHHHAVKNKYFLHPCSVGGIILKWFRDEFAQDERKFSEEHGLDVYDLLTLQASKIPAGSGGIIILPHFTGALSPEPEPKFKGAIFGLSLSHGKAHIIRAIMESIAFEIRRNLEVLEELGIKVGEVRSIGGGSRSSLWNQIKSDVIQKPVTTLQTDEASCLGAAILAGVAGGMFNDIIEGCERMVKIKGKYEPFLQNRDVYDFSYKKYNSLFKNAKRLYRKW